ncbi:hypothetical protein Tco_0312418 [Tanacetum coccineum]
MTVDYVPLANGWAVLKPAFAAIALAIEDEKLEIFMCGWWLCPDLYRFDAILEAKAKKVYASSPLLLCPKAVTRLLLKSETRFVRLRFTLLVEEDSGGVSSSSSRLMTSSHFLVEEDSGGVSSSSSRLMTSSYFLVEEDSGMLNGLGEVHRLEEGQVRLELDQGTKMPTTLLFQLGSP